MKILKLNNNHIKDEPEKEYGCICKNCGTVFVFKASEATCTYLGNRIFPLWVRCPNKKCDLDILINQCTEFKNLEEKNQFIRRHEKE